MSIELKQAAQQALEAFDAFGDADDFATMFALTQKMNALRTAIQQAEAQQPATSEPVVSRNPFASRCYTMSESHLSGHRLIVGFEKLGDVQDAHEWVARQARGDFTHPAPGVPDDVVQDAERWRVSELISEAALKHPDSRTEAENTAFNAYRASISSGNSYASCIDAAMLASQAQKGGE